MGDVVGPRNIYQGLPCGPTCQRLRLLMGREGWLPAELHASGFGPGPAFGGPRQDQAAFKLRQPRKDRYHELAMWRRGIGPRISRAPKASVSLRYRIEGVEQIAS
jgi:hypothetical protein